MKICLCILFTLITFSCSKDKLPEKKTFDSYGNPTKECSIRDSKGLGPYEVLGRLSSRECLQRISKLCNKDKYKQIHRHKGHFARGKFGEKIMIGTCP